MTRKIRKRHIVECSTMVKAWNKTIKLGKWRFQLKIQFFTGREENNELEKKTIPKSLSFLTLFFIRTIRIFGAEVAMSFSSGIAKKNKTQN